MATDKSTIEKFLRDVKEKIRFFGIVFTPRDKNTDALAALDITPLERENYIKNLTVEDYYRGPKPNKNSSNPNEPDYYEFGLNIKDDTVYIKLSLGLPNKQVQCMSFHPAEREIDYPYKL